MGQRISYDAELAKKGMSLKELLNSLNNAAGLAEVNEKDLSNCKVTCIVNFGGGIKQVIVEV
jgi:hypothetical protein